MSSVCICGFQSESYVVRDSFLITPSFHVIQLWSRLPPCYLTPVSHRFSSSPSVFKSVSFLCSLRVLADADIWIALFWFPVYDPFSGHCFWACLPFPSLQFTSPSQLTTNKSFYAVLLLCPQLSYPLTFFMLRSNYLALHSVNTYHSLIRVVFSVKALSVIPVHVYPMFSSS